jgi:hypothetical protein
MKKSKEIPKINYHQLKEEGEEEERLIFNLQPSLQLALLTFDVLYDFLTTCSLLDYLFDNLGAVVFSKCFSLGNILK